MTAYGRTTTPAAISAAARAAKAERRAVLERVKAQRAQAYKKTVAEWIELGAVILGSELKERYQISPRKSP
jgi:hypothetical protein